MIRLLAVALQQQKRCESWADTTSTVGRMKIIEEAPLKVELGAVAMGDGGDQKGE